MFVVTTPFLCYKSERLLTVSVMVERREGEGERESMLSTQQRQWCCARPAVKLIYPIPTLL